jgi:hypothetical protein
MQICLKKTSDAEKDLNPIEFDGLKKNYSRFYGDTLRCARAKGVRS